MESEVGVVTAMKGTKVTVLFNRRSMCDKCGACGLASDGKNMNLKMDVKKNEFRIGDRVVMEMDTKYFMVSPLVLYGIPLVFLILGALLGYFVFGSIFSMDAELLTALTALGMTVLSFFLIKAFEPFFKNWRKGKLHLVKLESTDIEE